MTESLKTIFWVNHWNLTDKMKKIFGIILLGMLVFSCSDKSGNKVKTVEKVIHCYAETDTKWVTYIYEVVGTDSTWVAERWYHENGELQLEGPIVDNKREGEFRGYYPTKELMSVGTFVDGKREGKGKIYFENGKVNVNNEYHDGKPSGIWEYFDEEGHLVDVQVF